MANSLSFYIVNVSFSTLRIINIKILIIYSLVSHTTIYVINVFNNTIQNIESSIVYKNFIFIYSYS